MDLEASLFYCPQASRGGYRASLEGPDMNKLIPDSSTTFSTFVELLRWRSSHQPDRQIYSYLADTKTEEVRLSYIELDQKARKIAHSLQNMGTAGERALLLYPPGPEYLAALYGCLYAEVVAVPAYPPRLNRPVSRLSAIVEDAQATLALTTTPILSKVESRISNVPGLGSLRWLATDDLEDELATGWRDPAVSSETLAILQYTSGSTASPKGVMLNHSNLLHQSHSIKQAMGLSTQDRGLIWLPPYHDMGLFTGLLQPLFSDFPVMLMPPLAFAQDPLQWLQAISHHRATFSGGPDSAYALCVHRIPPEQRKILDLSSWAVAMNGAEPINAAVLEQFEAAFGPCGFRREAFYPGYGLAEASMLVSGVSKAAPPVILSVQRKTLENNLVRKAHQEDRGSQMLVGCGEVVGGQRLVIADPQSLTECRPNQVGEIWVSGPSAAQGYWNQPEATQRDFFAYLAGTEEGPFLRTGDLGFLNDGELFVTGRLKDLLIIRGLNYYPQDIESVAEQSHPALRPKHSVAFMARFEGEDQLVVVCEVERSHRKSLDADEAVRKIRRMVAEQYELPVYAVVLARTGSVPKTSSGKIRRRACKEMFLSGSLETLRTDILEVHDLASKKDGLYTRVPTEVAVAGIWEEVLGLERVEIHDDFFELGGHSLLAMELITWLNRHFGVELLPRALFDAPTVAELALAVTQAQAEAETDIDRILAEVEQAQGLPTSQESSEER
jgi:acyl-CoA synthetase (AMP-forming)/AMP-acid ligase II/acyl carrier protein